MGFQHKIIVFTGLLILLVVSSISLRANPLTIKETSIIASRDIRPKVTEAACRILVEEVVQRTGLSWKISEKWPAKGTVIALVLSSSSEILGKAVPQRTDKSLPEWKPEGFRIWVESRADQKTIWVIGADNRAVIFGIGELLRTAEMSKANFVIDDGMDIATSPAYSLRGHQIGYRNTANSYDAWTVAQYDKYIRELALFGTNAIENIPPLSPNDRSVHFKIPAEEMNVKMSEICDSYDLDYWVWTPAEGDLSDPEVFKKQLDVHEANYKNVPRLDDVFFPGGDPGDNHPRYVMPFLKELHARLIKYHPNAGIWISLQGFSQEQIDYFYQYLRENHPTWLRGVVSGPSSPSISETRYRLPAQYKHRHYPDITHNVRCDYPAPNFDQAYALTAGREAINPMPDYYAGIHGKYAPFTDGFVSYSDGCHDDVNKIIWSQRGWDPSKSVQKILEEYGRFFFGPSVADASANGILGLEKNWYGPLAINGTVSMTMAYWKNLEKSHPEYAGNWRWQMLVVRAYYDWYVRQRLLNEGDLETKANAILNQAEQLGAGAAMKSALEIVNKADTEPIEKETRQVIESYFQKLFETIGLQTSVAKFQASGSQRGCMLDFVDYPLSNRWWLQDQFKNISEMPSEAEKLDRIKIIANWENPGPGSYYDDISNIAKSPHVKTTVYDAVDFGWWDDGYCRWRLSSQVYQNDPVLEYEDLDPEARYIIRVTGYGDALIRVDGQRLQPVVYNKEREQFKEFVVPMEAVGDGKIRVTFDVPEESHLRWRYYSSVSDVWLIKR